MSSTLDRLVTMANQIGRFFTPQRQGDTETETGTTHRGRGHPDAGFVARGKSEILAAWAGMLHG